MKRTFSLLIGTVLLLLAFSSCSKPTDKMSEAELLDLGEKHLLEMNYKQAADCFDRLIEVEPHNSRGHTGLAETYLAQGDIDKAADALRDGFESLPEDRDFLNDAAELYEGIAGDAPENVDIYLNFSDINAALGDGDAAFSVLEQGYMQTGSDEIKAKLLDLLPKTIEDWIIPPSIKADDILPLISAAHYPLTQWESVMNNPDYYFNVSKFVQNGRAGLIDSNGQVKLLPEYDDLYFYGVTESIIVENLRSENWLWNQLNADYSIGQPEGGVGGGWAFAFNYFDNRLYAVYGDGMTSIVGPLTPDGVVAVGTSFNHNVNLLPIDSYGIPEGGVWWFNPTACGTSFDSGAGAWNSDYQHSDGVWRGDVKFSYGKYGLIGPEGVVVDFDLDGAYSQTDGLFPVIKYGKVYYVTEGGRAISERGYDADNVFNFSEGLAAVGKNGLSGYISKTGEELISCQYEATRPIYDNKGWVKVNGEWGLADLSKYARYAKLDGVNSGNAMPLPEFDESVYADIVRAFMIYEESNWQNFDNPLIKDSFLVIPQTEYGLTPQTWDMSLAGTGYDINSIDLLHCLHDLNNDGKPELLIGAQEYISGTYFYSLFGVYTVVDGEVVSVIQKEQSRDYVRIYADNTIGSSWGHMDHGCDSRYSLTLDGVLKTEYSYQISPAGGDNSNIQLDENGYPMYEYKDSDGNIYTQEQLNDILAGYTNKVIEPVWNRLDVFFQ